MNILDIAIAKKLAGGGGGSGTDNYNDLSNLPKINDTTLSGNKSSSALGLQSEINSDSKLASDLVDDTNQDNKFVTSTEKNTWNGKQNAIDADHKINADYVDDSTSTNKFVTASDKETWNAKQNAIDNSHKLSSDLVDDANHTNKFVTSTEKQTWNAKQNAIDADHKLSSSLVSFSTAEAAALASGIDSTKVGQISTNQTNILYGLNTGVKNWFVAPNGNYSSSAGGAESTWEFTDGACKVIKCTSNDTRAAFNIAEIKLPAGDYVMTGRHLVNGACDVRLFKDGTNITTSDVSRFTLSTESVVEVAAYTYGTASVGTILKPLLCTAEAYAQSTDYQPPALPNYDLTYLEAEDRASLAEVVDSGAKNLFSDNNVSDVVGVTWNSSTGTATQSSTDTQSNLRLKLQCRNGSSGNFTELFNNQVITANGVVSFEFTCPTAATQLRFGHNGSQADATMILTGFNLQANTKYYIQCNVINCVQASGAYSWNKIMVCTKAAFGVSSKFVPYRPNYDLVCQYTSVPRTKIVYCSASGSSKTHEYIMTFNDFEYAQFDGTKTCGTYLISVVTWGFTPKVGVWLVSYTGGDLSYNDITNIVNPSDATVTVQIVNNKKIQVVSSGKVTISTLN